MRYFDTHAHLDDDVAEAEAEDARQAGVRGDRQQHRARQPDQRQRGIERLHRLHDRGRDVHVFGGAVVERAVQLDVRDRHAAVLRKCGERRQLVRDAACDGVGRIAGFAPAEVFAIGVAGMRAGSDAMRGTQSQRRADRVRVAGMRAAGDVGGRDQRHELGVVAAAFAEVAVEVDGGQGGHSSVGSSSQRSPRRIASAVLAIGASACRYWRA